MPKLQLISAGKRPIYFAHTALNKSTVILLMELTKRRATSLLQMYWHRDGARPSATTILTHIWINCRMKRCATCMPQNKLWTHWGRVPHISHYLNRCWDIVNWTLRSKLERNLDRNSYIFYQKNVYLKMSSPKWRPFCPGRDELNKRFQCY